MPNDYIGFTSEELRFLLALFNLPEEKRKYTEIAAETKIHRRTILRVAETLKEKGLVTQAAGRHPQLTELGESKAKEMNERVRMIRTHLIYEGMSELTAENTAVDFFIAAPDEFYEIIARIEKMFRIKYEFRDTSKFTGADYCRILNDGVYNIKFQIIKSSCADIPQDEADKPRAKYSDDIAMAEDAFEHPAMLTVQSGKGMLAFKRLTVSRESEINGMPTHGKAGRLEYYIEETDEWVSLPTDGEFITMPFDYFAFRKIGSDVSSMILRGTQLIRVDCTNPRSHKNIKEAVISVYVA